MKKADRFEVYRYMGFRDEVPEPHIRELADRITEEVENAASPKFCAEDVKLTISGDTVEIDGFSVKSASLANHLSGCDSAVMFAATLGTGVDMLIYKYSLTSPASAVAAQAAATVMIEAYADEICGIFEEEEKKNGLYITRRFSPGYGDLSLENQKYFLDKLVAGTRIGLFLTESDMLTPVKSVTAIVGKTKVKSDCGTGKCVNCQNYGCAYRNE